MLGERQPALCWEVVAIEVGGANLLSHNTQLVGDLDKLDKQGVH